MRVLVSMAYRASGEPAFVAVTVPGDDRHPCGIPLAPVRSTIEEACGDAARIIESSKQSCADSRL